jgi:LuxR family maltose regulon positive regulatory protein
LGYLLGLYYSWGIAFDPKAVAHHAHGEKEAAVQLQGDALALVESEGFVRVFLDKGPPMAHLLHKAQMQGSHRSMLAGY